MNKKSFTLFIVVFLLYFINIYSTPINKMPVELKQPDGTIKTYIRVVEGYRPGPGLPPKQRPIESFGCLEDQTDPEAFMKEVEEFNRNYRLQNVPLRIEAEGTARMYCEENRRQNYGYKYLETVYNL